MAVAWPESDVPTAALIEGYLEESEDNVVRQKPQVGPPKVRRRSSVPTKMLTWYQILTFGEWDALEDWYEDDLTDGTQTFTRTHPRDEDQTITALFEERPKSGSPISHNKFKVMFKARVFPVIATAISS